MYMATAGDQRYSSTSDAVNSDAVLRDVSDRVLVFSIHMGKHQHPEKRDLTARFYRGYYNLNVERRPHMHEFWIGVYSEPALLDMEG